MRGRHVGAPGLAGVFLAGDSLLAFGFFWGTNRSYPLKKYEPTVRKDTHSEGETVVVGLLSIK